jgi:tripartite-type tricarboxylate transporter receptor subunit TctC
VLPLVQAGRLRALAVTSRERTPLVQGLPGMKEAGLADYEVTVWYGFFAPAGTSAEIVKRLFEATHLTLQNPNLKQALARDGTETSGSRSPGDFAEFVREEAKLWTQVIRASGAKFD